MFGITLSSSVLGVVMFGQKCDHAGVIIELKEQYSFDVGDDLETNRVRNFMWSAFRKLKDCFNLFDLSKIGLQ